MGSQKYACGFVTYRLMLSAYCKMDINGYESRLAWLPLTFFLRM